MILQSALIAFALYTTSRFGCMSFMMDEVTMITSSAMGDSSLITRYII